ncbi:methyltransferase domain-containing protein [Legionella dresdenensis]|uniref:Methyltransferase domain-containing protein n=1 Tax=Legionella dresdenensis TaxID=450200 RepID=A0ABV8CE11_9GAMM
MKKVIYHKQKLIDLLGNYEDKSILDYGCGDGDFIDILLKKNQKPNVIYAVDAEPKMIEKVNNRFKNLIDQQLVIPKLVSTPQELEHLKFDKIICHNVLECIDDKLTFINNFSKLLKSHSIFILSHHDFDSALYNSHFKNLTRQLVHHFSDTQQQWQKYSDGQMGRKIPGLLSQSIFNAHYHCETWRLFETKFIDDNYGFLMADMLMDAGKGHFPDSELHQWYQDLVKKHDSGEYYFAIDLVYAICTFTIPFATHSCSNRGS